MATFFFDIDGTIVDYHTSKWLPDVRERLIKIASMGHRIVFITQRGWRDRDGKEGDAGTPWCEAETHKLLGALPFKYDLILGLEQPRFIIDDGHPFAIKIQTNHAEEWLHRIGDT